MSTIVGIATALSKSGISIIRVSGEDAVMICSKIFKGKNLNNLKNAKSHYLYYGFIYDNNEYIDEVLICFMKGPKSYTAEDTVEINCHGGVAVTKKIFNLLVQSGAVIAEPGEFTKRAFMNGRINLAQAEAVMDIINSDNEYSLKAGINNLRGSLNVKINKIRLDILDIIGYIEASLDDPEANSTEMLQNRFSETLTYNSKELSSLIASYDNGKIIKNGINTILLGKPNVGKSSILNLLSGYERAIVSDIAGTTRDTISENIIINGISLNLHDTAGINETEDIIEKLGVERAISLLENIDLCLYICDSSVPLDFNDFKVIEACVGKKIIVIINKSDLESVINQKNIFDCMVDKGHMEKDFYIINTSVKENYGFEKLEEIISALFDLGNIELNNENIITSLRQKECLSNALVNINNAIECIYNNMSDEFIDFDLMSAYKELSKFLGEEVEEDYVNQVFENFCVGK